MMCKTLKWSWVENFAIQVFTDGTVSQGDWNSLVADLKRNRERIRGVLVVTKGGTPSALQRAELRNVLDQGPPVPAAIMAESQLVCIGLSALNLFLQGAARPKPFPPHQLDKALAYLNVPHALWLQCRQVIAEMQRELGIDSPSSQTSPD